MNSNTEIAAGSLAERESTGFTLKEGDNKESFECIPESKSKKKKKRKKKKAGTVNIGPGGEGESTGPLPTSAGKGDANEAREDEENPPVSTEEVGSCIPESIPEKDKADLTATSDGAAEELLVDTGHTDLPEEKVEPNMETGDDSSDALQDNEG